MEEKVLFSKENVPSTGTRYGPSYYSTANLCMRKARLSAEKRALGLDSDEEAEKDPTKNAYKRLVGQMCHALLAEYHGKGSLGNFVLPSDVPEQSGSGEALRLFKSYRDVIRPDSFGRVLATELALPRPDTDDADRLLATFGDHVGTEEMSGGIDMVTEMEQPHADWLTNRGCAGVQPGNWIIDHKTSEKATDGRYYLSGIQLPMYIVMMRAIGYDIKGAIINCIIRHKPLYLKDGSIKAGTGLRDLGALDGSFRQFVRPYLPGHDEALVLNVIRRVQRNKALYPNEATGSPACTFFSACEFLGKECPGY